jgi:thiol-disulfide isomerase/thioredoxin
MLLACKDEHSAPLPPEADPLTALDLPLLDGGKFDPASVEGKVVVINFWSPSCRICAREIPSLQTLAAELGPKGLELVTIMVDGTPAGARRFAAKVGVTAPILLGPEALRRRWQVAAYPWTIVVDRSGKAVHAVRGLREEAVFRKLFQQALDS